MGSCNIWLNHCLIKDCFIHDSFSSHWFSAVNHLSCVCCWLHNQASGALHPVLCARKSLRCGSYCPLTQLKLTSWPLFGIFDYHSILFFAAFGTVLLNCADTTLAKRALTMGSASCLCQSSAVLGLAIPGALLMLWRQGQSQMWGFSLLTHSFSSLRDQRLGRWGTELSIAVWLLYHTWPVSSWYIISLQNCWVHSRAVGFCWVLQAWWGPQQ